MSDPDPAKYNAEGTGPMDVALTANVEIYNVAGLCLFGMFTGAEGAQLQLLEAVTGWSFGLEEQMAAATRILNMKQAFNLREGLKPADFVLPERSVGEPPLEAGPLSGITIDHVKLGGNFFAAMGWALETGRPSRQALEAMGGMEDVARDLYG
jgi:aldehyde:ferredoxin oxidoreductase